MVLNRLDANSIIQSILAIFLSLSDVFSNARSVISLLQTFKNTQKKRGTDDKIKKKVKTKLILHIVNTTSRN